MGEHYTKNTVEVTAYCRKCKRNTQHRVDGNRRGPCLECKAQAETKAQARKKLTREDRKRQKRLFD